MAKKKERSKRERRSMRANQIIFAVVGIMIILAMVLSMISF